MSKAGIGIVLTLAVVGCSSTPIEDTGCGPSPELTAPTEFTRIEDRISTPLTLALINAGTVFLEPSVGIQIPSDMVVDTPLQVVIPLNGAIATDGVAAYYLSDPLDREITLPEFLGRDGVFLLQAARPPGENIADTAMEIVGDRAQRIPVGDNDGAIVFGDEVLAGVRPYRVVWSDDAWSYTLRAVRSPAQLIDLARSVACR